jgi:predicted phage-related endonuclease
MGSTPSNLSASRISAILGCNKYKSPLRAWLEIKEELEPGFCAKNGYTTPVRIDPFLEPLDSKHASLRFGLSFENSICDLKGNVINREKAFVHPDYPFITCHIDGQTIVNSETINQENKTIFDMAFKMGWGDAGSDMIDKGYMIQIQVQMLLSNTFKTDLNALVFPKPPAEWEKMGYRVDLEFESILYPDGERGDLFVFAKMLKDLGYYNEFYIKADLELQNEIVKQCVYFWNENILKSIAPPINGYDDIKWLFASPEGEIQLDGSPIAKNEGCTEEELFTKERHIAMIGLWDEKCSTENEIKSMQDRIYEIKNSFAGLIQIEYSKKNVKEGNEDHKLNIYAGARKLASISRPRKSTKISAKMVDTAKDNSPKLYEEMKKTSFLDIMGDLLLTEKQIEKVDVNSDLIDALIMEVDKDSIKFLKSLKLSKLLSKDSHIKTIQKNRPEMYNFFYENGIVEETEGKARLTMTKNVEE